MSVVSGTPIGVALSRLAVADPATAAVTCGAVTLSRQELEERANRLAWELRDRDVRVGDRIAITLSDGVDFVISLVGIWKAGGSPLPVPPWTPAEEREQLMRLAAAKLVIAASGTDTLPPTAGEDQPTSPPPGIAPTPWKIVFSGGSSGRPKLVAAITPGVAERTRVFGVAAQMSPGGAALLTAPPEHGPSFISLAAALLLGKHVVLMESGEPAEALRLAAEHHVDWMFAVPAMMHRIWRLPDDARAAADLSALRVVVHLGAPIAPWLKEAWIGWLGADRVWELFTGSEAQAVTRISGQEWLAHRRSVGRPLTGDIQVRDEYGRTLGPGHVGSIWMRPDAGRTYAYIGTKPQSDGRWETLGDLGYIDADGYLYLADHDTDVIVVGGAQVYPSEVEGALEEHPAVRSAAVIGLPDDDLGAVPHAIVEAETELDTAELLVRLRERLDAHKLPRSFEFVTEPLRDEAGKMRRTALRAARLPVPAQSAEA